MSDINDLHGGVRRSAFVEYCRHCKHLMTPDHECADHCKGCADLRDEKTQVEKLGAEIKRLDPTPPSRIDWIAVVEAAKKLAQDHNVVAVVNQRPLSFPDRPIIPFDLRHARPVGDPITVYSRRIRLADDDPIFFYINRLRESGDAMMQIHDEAVLNLNVDADQEWKAKLKIDAAWVPEPSILGRLSRRAREMWAAARRAVGL